MSEFEERTARAEGEPAEVPFPGAPPALQCLLDAYYQHDVYGCSDIEEVPEDAAAGELTQPLEERASGILAKMKWLLARGADVNSGSEWPPLMLAVCALDVPVTAWLLEHGADPLHNPWRGGCQKGGYDYIDMLDAMALQESLEGPGNESRFDRILQLALLFAGRGVTDIHLHCISVDGESRTVTVSQAAARF